MNNPLVSVVVLTKNRPEYIKLCLDSILKQQYDNFEVLIIDSDSNLETIGIICRYSTNTNVSVFGVPHCSIGLARQIGSDMAQGDIVAYIDSDVELPHEYWIEHMVKPFNDPYVAGVQTLAKAKNTDPDILKKVHSSFEYKHNIIDIDNYEPVGTSHILIRNYLINACGGFKDISFKEDTDLTYRIMQMGFKFVYLPDEKCYHYHVKNYGDYLKKELRNKYKGLICTMRGIK